MAFTNPRVRWELKASTCFMPYLYVPVLYLICMYLYCTKFVCTVLYLILMYLYLRGEPTELCDGNYHRNKTILFWSNGMTSPHRKYRVFPLKDNCFNRKWTFRLKYSQTDRKPLKFIENACTHWAFRPILIGKHAHRKGNIKHV